MSFGKVSYQFYCDSKMNKYISCKKVFDNDAFVLRFYEAFIAQRPNSMQKERSHCKNTKGNVIRYLNVFSMNVYLF